MAEGHVFACNKFEAIVGSDIPRLTGKTIGVDFQATHGLAVPGRPPDIHMQHWTVVGVLAPTHTAIDRCVYHPPSQLLHHCRARGRPGRPGASSAKAKPPIPFDPDADRIIPI